MSLFRNIFSKRKYYFKLTGCYVCLKGFYIMIGSPLWRQWTLINRGGKRKVEQNYYCVRKQHTSRHCWVHLPPFIFKPLCGYLCEYLCEYLCGYLCGYLCEYLCEYLCGYLWTSFSSRVFHQILGFFIELRTLGSNDAKATRTSLKKWICVL